MTAKADVYQNKLHAGVLEKCGPSAYVFTYAADYLADPENPSISLTLSRKQPEHRRWGIMHSLLPMIS